MRWVGLGLLLALALPASRGQMPQGILAWMQGPPPLDGRPAYTAVHVESRGPRIGPKQDQDRIEPDESLPWTPVTGVLQPFRSLVDRKDGKVYWRKSFFDQCAAAVPCDFYGEVFGYTDAFVHLRAESFPVFGGKVDDGHTWDIRPDKFRLFARSGEGGDRLPHGVGRIWAPMQVADGWSIEQTFDTYACLSFAEYLDGSCRIYQKAFHDAEVRLDTWRGFSTVFDGEIPGFGADQEYRSFDTAIVLSQIMGKGRVRERFFLAGKVDAGTGAFQAFGFVRWDKSVRNAAGRFVVVTRAVGLRRLADKAVTFEGMRRRARLED